jgi:hypothetical protein
LKRKKEACAVVDENASPGVREVNKASKMKEQGMETLLFR